MSYSFWPSFNHCPWFEFSEFENLPWRQEYNLGHNSVLSFILSPLITILSQILQHQVIIPTFYSSPISLVYMSVTLVVNWGRQTFARSSCVSRRSTAAYVSYIESGDEVRAFSAAEAARLLPSRSKNVLDGAGGTSGLQEEDKYPAKHLLHIKQVHMNMAQVECKESRKHLKCYSTIKESGSELQSRIVLDSNSSLHSNHRRVYNFPPLHVHHNQLTWRLRSQCWMKISPW